LPSARRSHLGRLGILEPVCGDDRCDGLVYGVGIRECQPRVDGSEDSLLAKRV
jgi:hypothetical protein